MFVAFLCALTLNADTFFLGDGHEGVLDVPDNRVINSYARLASDVAPGTTGATLTLRSLAEPMPFAVGDLVLLHQTAKPNASFTPGDVGYDATSVGVGYYELARLQTVVTASTLQVSFT